MEYTCPVCGWLHLSRKPHDGVPDPSYEICPSCGFEFGVSDDDEGITYEEWRADWIGAGNQWIKGNMRWFSSGTKEPAGWDPKKQLENIGIYL